MLSYFKWTVLVTPFCGSLQLLDSSQSLLPPASLKEKFEQEGNDLCACPYAHEKMFNQ